MKSLPVRPQSLSGTDFRLPIAWAIVALLLTPIACSGMAAEPQGGDETASGAAGLIDMLPADATTVGRVDFDAMRSSQLFEMFAGEDGFIDESPDLQEFIDKTSIDPRTDLHTIAFMSGRVVGDELDTVGLVARATFDRSRLEAALAEQEGAETEPYSGYTLHAMPEWSRTAGEGENQVEIDRAYIAIIDDETIAFGSGSSVRKIIDVLGGAASVRTNAALAGLMEDADGGSDLWVVSAQEAMFSEVTPPAGAPVPAIPIERIDAMIVSLDLADGLALKLRGRTASEEDARLLGDSLNGMLAFGKMMLQSNRPEIFDIFDRGVDAGSSGRDVTLSATLTAADIEALRAFAEESIGGLAPARPGL